MFTREELEAYSHEATESAKQFIRELAVIPAPSHHEEKRAAWMKAWLEAQGAEGVFIDEALNCVWPVNDTGDNDLVVFMAHLDVVFPDTEPLPFHEDGNYFYCPGVGDDTAMVAALMTCAKYFHDRKAKPKCGMLIVANSCEEGLGNLKGSRRIIDTYSPRVKELITIDGGMQSMVTRAVGSHRYRVTVRTEGGHSYGSFGNRNAIAYLSSMISTLYDMKVPSKPDTKTTYNVGSISGGTSVNTIAQSAEMLYEYRSDDRECLETMRTMFEAVVNAYRAMGITVEVELLGERPCNGDLDPDAIEALRSRVRESAKEVLGIENLIERPGSTDANYPLSKGIPAVCFGAAVGYGAHTREEKIELSSIQPGLHYLLDFMSKYFEA